MSERNVAIARRFLEAHSAGRIDALLQTLHPEVVLYIRGKAIRGREAAADWAAPPLRTLQFQLQPEKVLGQGNHVFAQVRMQFRWKRSGDLADDRSGAAVFDVDDGRIVRFKLYDDRKRAQDEWHGGVAWATNPPSESVGGSV